MTAEGRQGCFRDKPSSCPLAFFFFFFKLLLFKLCQVQLPLECYIQCYERQVLSDEDYLHAITQRSICGPALLENNDTFCCAGRRDKARSLSVIPWKPLNSTRAGCQRGRAACQTSACSGGRYPRCIIPQKVSVQLFALAESKITAI